MYKIAQVNNCYSRISRNCAKADRYKTRFFDAKFLDERAKARSEVLTKRFLRINSRARAIIEKNRSILFPKNSQQMTKMACFSVFLMPFIGNFSETRCFYSFQYSSRPRVYPKEAFGEYFASCFSTLVKKFGVEKSSFIAIGFGAIPAYSTVAVVDLDYFIHRLVDGAFNTTYLCLIALFVSTL